MKTKLITSILLTVFILNTLFTQSVYALSCIPITPTIGTIAKITTQESSIEISLNDFYTFSTDNLSINGIYALDRYESLAKKYVTGDLEPFEKATSFYSEKINIITISATAYLKTNVQIGDIIIHGPPNHVCSYGFTGLFSSQGKLQNAIIYDNYNDYSYHNNKLEVAPGEELSCENDKCKMSVDFKIDGLSLRLSPGEAHNIADSSINLITLLDSSDLKNTNTGSVPFDWGFGTFANYLLTFNNSYVEPEIPTTIPPSPPKPPTAIPKPIPAPKPQEEIPQTEQVTEATTSENISPVNLTDEPLPVSEIVNFFQRIWRFCLSFFQ